MSEISVAAPRRHMPIAARVALGIAAVAVAGVLLARPGWLRPGDGGSTATGAANPGELTREAAALLARADRAQNADNAIALLERAVAADPEPVEPPTRTCRPPICRKHTTDPDAQWMKLARETAEHAVDLNGDLGAARLAVGFVRSRQANARRPTRRFEKQRSSIR